jgi:hypothetical protein
MFACICQPKQTAGNPRCNPFAFKDTERFLFSFLFHLSSINQSASSPAAAAAFIKVLATTNCMTATDRLWLSLTLFLSLSLFLSHSLLVFGCSGDCDPGHFDCSRQGRRRLDPIPLTREANRFCECFSVFFYKTIIDSQTRNWNGPLLIKQHALYKYWPANIPLRAWCR